MGVREVAESVRCRLCGAPVARNARVCPTCGVKSPWISDEPSLDPRLLRIVTWGGGIVLVILLLFVSGMLIFGPAVDDDERDHRPTSAGTVTDKAR